MQEDASPQSQPAMPFAPQPRGLAFFLKTWTGRIIIVNTVVFLAMAWQSGNILMPDPAVLEHFGAKDPVLLTQGQWWRFVTPIFVHIGLLHFSFNTWALYAIAWQTEFLLTGRWFLGLYLVAGLIGNIASSVFSTAVSAGASSSLFGVLGAGFLVERIVTKRFEERTGRRARTGAYTGMVVGNLILGFIIPQIDNSAHVGGLIGGIVFTLALLSLVPNRLLPRRRALGITLAVCLTLGATVGAVLGSSETFLSARLNKKMTETQNPLEKFHLYSDALRLHPSDPKLHWERAKLLLLSGYPEEAAEDLKFAASDAAIRNEMQDFQGELVKEGRLAEAGIIARFLTEPPQ